MIAIIDYGMGNLRSVQKAFEFLGFDAVVTDDPKIIESAQKVVLPGVGAFCEAIKTIREKGIDKVIHSIVEKGTPFLGICLGMQMLFDKSYENGEYDGLGIIPGRIVRLPETEKIPHIGWNSLDIKLETPLFEGIGKEPYVYFVHSYYLETDAPVVSATCFYGREIQVAAQKGNVFALQFHPEKSGDTGLKILENFGRI
ncbi:imidazole glycerol phosphate synthase subunit HisH [Anaerotignum faecicola]|nr:imidazole glycerol phosphate synthase subunit HisH [Anaerotignum faecicola]